MYYDLNPGRRINESITNVYEDLLDWIDRYGEEDIKEHIEQILDERKRMKETEK